jgi:hypothetical protein
MAELKLEGDKLVVRLNLGEAFLAWRRELKVPLAQLRMVRVEERPFEGLALCRLPGLVWPGALAVGACRRGGLREFAAVHAGRPALVLDVEGGRWDRLVHSHPQAAQLAADLAAMLLARGPSRPSRKAFPAALD